VGGRRVVRVKFNNRGDEEDKEREGKEKIQILQ
jgi:hypothetical protein